MTPRYHPQYRSFRGYVDINAADGALLPWNTTKTGVDENSPVWQKTYGLMRAALLEAQGLLNRLKDERADELNGQAPGPAQVALSNASLVAVEQIPAPKNAVAKYPTAEPKATSAPVVRIAFSVDRRRYEAVAAQLNESKASDVGRRLFEYFWKLEVD